MSESTPEQTPATRAMDVAPRAKSSNYPEPYYSRMAKREKRALGDHFGLTKFGVNLTRLSPGGESALLHKHTRQEEFVFVLEGRPTLVTEEGETELSPGMCVGFPPNGAAHQLANRTEETVAILEVGDRPEGDEGAYPADDIKAMMGADGKWAFVHKDGTPF